MTATPAPAPFHRYDPSRGPSAVQYRHVDPRTGLLVPSPPQPRKARPDR